jgi:hypothetical protein
VLRAWRNLPWTLSFLGAALALPAAAQNLDAGKSPGQIFSEVCANCHRSVRDFRNGVSASFLREHYTTSSDMASTMAAYLSGARTDPRSQPAQPPRPPASTATTAHEQPAAPEPKRAQQGADPKAAATSPSQPANRNRPTTARADAKPAETKPPAAPPAPVLEEFEE